MNTSKLLEYLSIIIDLEKDKYIQTSIINQLVSEIKSYQNEYHSNNTLNEQILLGNKTPNNINVNQSGKVLMIFLGFYLSGVGIALGSFTYSISHNIILTLIATVVGISIGCSIPAMIWKSIINKRRQKAIQQGMHADSELIQIRQSRNKDIEVILPRLQRECENMQQTCNLTCETLKKCYDINIIPVKYRSLVPVCMFYDYILNKRTYSIERNPQTADEGAINMYETELFRREILGKLNDILYKLDEISQNQKVLYNAVQEGNRQTHALLNDINNNISKTNKNLQTIQYQNDCRNKYMEYMSYVTYQRYMTR